MSTNVRSSSGEQSIVIVENWRVTIAGVMGNVLEFYDFALFGFFSDVIAEVFFPPEEYGDDDNSNLIITFVIFGAAFLMRPFGGLAIGYIGDKHGRKTALTSSLFLMAIPTTLLGCLPTYDSVGILAPILLMMCRLLQGLSVGGQLPASLVYLVEKKDKSQWGYYGSLPLTAATFGILLGNLNAGLTRKIFSREQMVAWAWRIPFFSGILVAVVACYLKIHGAEVHIPGGVHGKITLKDKNPIKTAFRRGNRLSLFEAFLTPMVWASGSYVTHVWMAIYMTELLDPPVEHAFLITACSLLSTGIMLPIAGHLSDKVGRVPLMTASAIMVTILGPIQILLTSQGFPFLAFLSQISLSAILSFFGGPMCAWLIENFPADVRLTSVAVGYDLCLAVVGGFSPLLATALFNVGTSAPGIIYGFFGIVSTIGIYTTYFLNGCQKEKACNNLELLEHTTETVEEIGEGRSDPEPKELPEVS